MKKALAKIIIAAAGIIFLFLAGGIIVKAFQSNATAKRIAKLPSFSLPTVEGNIFHSEDIEGGPLLIIYFHPECEHCQFEISSLIDSDIFSYGVRVILVSYASAEAIGIFMKQFIINDKNIQILCDEELKFYELSGMNVIPSNFIYSKDLKLVKLLKGELKTEVILKYLACENQYR